MGARSLEIENLEDEIALLLIFAIAAETMRRILVDYARAVNAQRRPKPNQRVQFDKVVVYSEDHAGNLLIIDEALTKLSMWDGRQAKVVELRFFGGLSIDEIAQVPGVSERAVLRDWTMARAWLSAQSNDCEGHASPG